MVRTLLVSIVILLSFQAAAAEIASAPQNSAWALRCNHHSHVGQYTPNFQITTTYLKDQVSLEFQYLDSIKGDSIASVTVDRIESLDNDILEYEGTVVKSSGPMFQKVATVRLELNMQTLLLNTKDTFVSKLYLKDAAGKFLDVKFPNWTMGSKLYCQLIPMQ